MIWFDLLRGTLWSVGGALALAAMSEAHAMRRWRNLPTDLLFASGLTLLALAALVSLRSVWLQVILSVALVTYAGWVCWRRLDRGAQSASAGALAIVRPRRRALLTTELVVWTLVAPLLWFPTLRPEVTALAMLLLAIAWLAVMAAGGGLWPRSRYDVALIVFLGVAMVGAWRSPYPELTLAKVSALVLGLGLYRLILRGADRRRAVLWSLTGMALLAVGFCLIGLPSGLRPSKIGFLGQIVAHLPRFVEDLPGTQNGRVSMNQLAGSLLYVLPVALAALVAPAHGQDERLGSGWRIILLVLAGLMSASLVLAQSRAAWLGLVFAILVILALRWPWGRWVTLVLVLLALGSWLVVGRERLGPALVDMLMAPKGATTPLGTMSFRGRLLIWERTVDYVAARPWLGYGLGTFRGVDGDPGAEDLIGAGLPHAHNVFLQTAFDLGLVGLAAYLAMLGIAVGSCWRIYRYGDATASVLAIGALAALAAYHVYGLADVVAIGAKPGVLWWALLAWIAALERTAIFQPAGE